MKNRLKKWADFEQSGDAPEEDERAAPGDVGWWQQFYAVFVDRRTGSGWRVPALDGLRGIAAIMVLISHTRLVAYHPPFSIVWAPIEEAGLGGVILFFALSGFLLYLPWLRSKEELLPAPRFQQYALRRCLRIMPAYYASVVGMATLKVVMGHGSIEFSAVLLHFLFLPMLMSPVQSLYWTLQVEEFFYWVLPGLHRLVLKIGIRAVLAFSMLTSLGWAAFAPLFPFDRRYVWLEETPFFLPVFVLGIWGAVRWRSERTAHARRLVVFGTLGYILLSPLISYVAYRTHHRLNAMLEVLAAPLASCVVLGVARGGAPLLEHPVLRFLGAISFSLYLWHMAILRYVPVPKLFVRPLGARLAFTVALSVPLAVISYLIVERPFLLRRPVAN
jgi:peptidoglycan/LPS O-acetylase OafA/YrhL